MADWLPHLVRLSASGTPCVLVTLAETRGSVPREAGTKMVVAAAATFGTIGGGQLEYEALNLAREMLASGASTPQLRRFGLGPSLGQCCGGSARILFEPMSERQEPWQAALQALVERGEPAVLVTEIGDGGAEKIVVSVDGVTGVLSDPGGMPRRWELHRRCCRIRVRARASRRPTTGRASVRAHPARGFHVVLLGAGHVGKALVRVLGELPCRVTWVDGRAEQFPREVPANVTVECTEMPQYAVERAPPGAAFLVMTHSHALDLKLCEKILRRRRLFVLRPDRLEDQTGEVRETVAGARHSRSLIERMVCPIGIPGLSGKHPGEIAVAVAAQLLMVRAASARSHATSPATVTS